MTEVYSSARTATFPGGVAVAGVVVRLYTSAGAFVTTATTDGAGLAYLGDRAAATYEIRVSAPAPSVISGGSIQSIVVPASASDYAFDLVVTTAAIPVATDALLCRCSGYFKDSHGMPLAGVTISFSESAGIPALLYYSGTNTAHAVIPIAKYVHTDNLGYVQVDLIRTKQYSVIMEGYEARSRIVQVPDLTSASLPDVLFPTVHRLEWLNGGSVIMPTTAPAISIAVDEIKALTVQTVFRSGMVAAGVKDVIVASDDETVASVTITEAGAVTLVGNGAGTAAITVTRFTPEAGCGVTIYPEPALVGELTVTVTP